MCIRASIARAASGFIYYVSLTGVTGAGHLDAEDVARHVALIRQYSDLPVAVGFGIKDAESARTVAGIADAVVVDSALVDAVARAMETGADAEAASRAAIELLTEIRAGIDSLAS